MRTILLVATLCVLMSGASGTIRACFWDTDTLATERSNFPNTLELITGKFPRHSTEFYEWRVRDRTRRLAEDPTDPALYDDLAVAHEKLGDHAKAIEIILAKDEHFPGQYETYANLGTFYFHAGDFPAGIEQIERAIAINPDAHFGREVYQLHIVKYVLSRRKDGEIRLPLVDPASDDASGFGKYILDNTPGLETNAARISELNKALRGVEGMMRFGNYESPILLEALGDLLIDGRGLNDAKQLAARAYLKASYASADAEQQKAYRKRAELAIRMQTTASSKTEALSLTELESQFKQELRDADRWYEKLRADERTWIRHGIDVDAEIQRKYLRRAK